MLAYANGDPVEMDGVDVVPVDPRLTLDWELRGVSAAVRRHRLDAFVTLSDRLPFARTVPIVVWLFESPAHTRLKRIKQLIETKQIDKDFFWATE